MIGAAVKKMIRFLFVGALSFFPLVVVLMLVNFFKNIGLSAYLQLNTLTDSGKITGILMIGVLLALMLLGWTIERYGRSVLLSFIDRLFEKIPAVNTIYSISRKISNMLTGKDESGKKEVVLVEYPKNDVWVPAYVLNRHNGICVLFIPTAITAPTTSLGSTGSRKRKWEGRMISTGTRAMMVEAIPVLVCWIATRLRETPRKGPKKAPMSITFIAALSLRAIQKFRVRRLNSSTALNPRIPARHRI